MLLVFFNSTIAAINDVFFDMPRFLKRATKEFYLIAVAINTNTLVMDE
jgi:hypothetical protein